MRDKYGFKMLSFNECTEEIPFAVLDRKTEIEMMQAGSPERFQVPSATFEILETRHLFKDYWLLDWDLGNEVILYEGLYWLFAQDECLGNFDSFEGMASAQADPDWDLWNYGTPTGTGDPDLG